MSHPTTYPIPAFYRVFFTSIDPLIALSGFYVDFFDPETLITSLFPASHPAARVTPSHTMILHQLGGSLLMMAFLSAFMLRRTHDVAVWKIFEFGILITDYTLFHSHWVGLGAQNRLAVENIRWEEWGTFAITGFVTVVRILFLAGVGFGNSGSMLKKNI